jgi:catechol 2,3-dioxygenase-like lactoylglutathione lyase family enzyme
VKNNPYNAPIICKAGGLFMINGAHIVIYSKDAEADRAFFRDVLKLPSVDAGHGWLIFAMPPAEAAFHDSEKNDQHELYFMCDDIAATLNDLRAKHVKVSEVNEQRWGKVAKFELPGGGKIGIYQPKHASPLPSGTTQSLKVR